jgi:cobalt/nickel transport system permease protein
MEGYALHIGDGIVGAQVSALFGVVAIAGLALCVAMGRRQLDDRLAPMAGLVAAFVFAAQMLNFPVLPGVSGHLLGGALAALLVGPWIGALCVAVVLVVQALLFADGGVTALGLNITNMALIGTAAAYLLIAAALRLLPRTAGTLTTTAFVASVVSVVAASQGFVLQYWLGGATDVGASIGGISLTMAGVHAAIGVGEGIITAVTVGAVAKVRPDLVHALRGRPPAATLAPAPTTVGGAA